MSDSDQPARDPRSGRIPLGFWRPVNTDNPDLPATPEQFKEQSRAFAKYLMQRINELNDSTVVTTDLSELVREVPEE